LDAGVIAKVSSKPFTTTDGVEMGRGTVMIPVGNNQTISEDELFELVRKVEAETGIDIHAVNTGTVDQGLMLGSRSAYAPLRKPEIAILVEGGTRSYDVGEVWHLLDQRFGIPVTKLSLDRVGRANLDRYNTIIMVDGSYRDLGEAGTNAIKEWMGPGRVLITQKGAASWAARNGLANLKMRARKDPDAEDTDRRAYEMAGRDRGGKVLGGAIYEATGDLTHPLMFGMQRESLPIFKRGTMMFEPPRNPYASPLMYGEDALLSGYSPRGFEDQLTNSAAIVVSGRSGGRSINFADNPNFRAFWYGTNRPFLNAIFFGSTISSATIE
jgi:hypothetical protein